MLPCCMLGKQTTIGNFRPLHRALNIWPAGKVHKDVTPDKTTSWQLKIIMARSILSRCKRDRSIYLGRVHDEWGRHDYYSIWFNFSAALVIFRENNRSHKTKNPFYSSRTMS
jgi:hypothetical protein